MEYLMATSALKPSPTKMVGAYLLMAFMPLSLQVTGQEREEESELIRE
jgi:hypothetical protein